MGLYFFWGQEEYNIEEEVQKIKDKYLDENFSSMNLRYFDAPDFKELQNILLTTGTMFGNIVNVVSCNRYIFKVNNQTILSDSQIEELPKFLNTPSDNVQTIFTLKIPRNLEYRELVKIPSKKLCKILQNNTNSKEFKQFRNYDKELFNWIIKSAKEKDLIISTDTAKMIADKTGVNLTLINSQLEKLQLNIYPRNKVTKEDITEFMLLTEDVFKIADYMLSNKRDLALLEFRKNCDKGKHHLEILALLQSKFSQFISVKSDIETLPLAEVAKKNGLGEYPTKLLLQKMNNLNLSQLVSMKKNLIRAEEAIKVNFSPSGELEIEKAILSDV